MTRKRFEATYTEQRGFHVNMPHYSMVPGTWGPIVPGKIHADGAFPGVDAADILKHHPSVLCDVPDSVPFKSDGQLDTEALRRRYPNDSVFGDRGWKPPKVLGDR